MEPGDTLARVVGQASALGLVAALPSFPLIPKLGLGRGSTITSYFAAVAIALCFGLLLYAMWAGLRTDWSSSAKAGMFLGAFMTIPAAVGAILFIRAGFAGNASAAVTAYFTILGILCLLLFALPAVVFFVMAMPGKP